MVLINGADENGDVKVALADTDDGLIDGELTTIVVINLNYVWDAGAEAWVRMLQP